MLEIIKVLIWSAIPLLEQRVSIPFGIFVYHMHPLTVFVTAFLGSLIPVPFILFFFSHIFEWLGKTRILKWFYDFVDRKVKKGKDKIEKYEKWGLILFVAIPLPTTGLWTGSAVAAFLKMDKKKAFKYVFIGGLISATIITAICVLLPDFANSFFKSPVSPAA